MESLEQDLAEVKSAWEKGFNYRNGFALILLDLDCRLLGLSSEELNRNLERIFKADALLVSSEPVSEPGSEPKESSSSPFLQKFSERLSDYATKRREKYLALVLQDLQSLRKVGGVNEEIAHRVYIAVVDDSLLRKIESVQRDYDFIQSYPSRKKPGFNSHPRRENLEEVIAASLLPEVDYYQEKSETYSEFHRLFEEILGDLSEYFPQKQPEQSESQVVSLAQYSGAHEFREMLDADLSVIRYRIRYRDQLVEKLKQKEYFFRLG